MIRIATPADAAGMLRIYAPFILQSGITQEVEVPDPESFAERIRQGLLNFPWLVFEEKGRVAGYAYASKYRERAGYQWCVETSVYIDPEFYGQQTAGLLYRALFSLLKLQGYINAYAVITLPNARSIAFHKKFGFAYFATYHQVGFKLDQWHDVGWMQYTIQEHETHPRDPIRFFDLREQDRQHILDQVLGPSQ
ncbi:MAG: GNAT family N-acetyltransferase [Terrimonas sp.]|nr:GNAT family N-acetyltransferase [Terrimonas sp.]